MLQSCDLQAFNLKQSQEVFVLGLLIIPVFLRMMTCVLTVSLLGIVKRTSCAEDCSYLPDLSQDRFSHLYRVNSITQSLHQSMSLTYQTERVRIKGLALKPVSIMIKTKIPAMNFLLQI